MLSQAAKMYILYSNIYIIFVDMNYAPYIVGVGIIAVAIIRVVGYVVFRRRIKVIIIPKTTK
jgi:hypothetical protein